MFVLFCKQFCTIYEFSKMLTILSVVGQGHLGENILRRSMGSEFGLECVSLSTERLSITFTANANLYRLTPFAFWFRLLFIISTHKLVVSSNFLSIRIVLSCFLGPFSILRNFLNLNLTFAVCRLPYT